MNDPWRRQVEGRRQVFAGPAWVSVHGTVRAHGGCESSMESGNELDLVASARVERGFASLGERCLGEHWGRLARPKQRRVGFAR
jgi:hypothetical protein